jgi:hypothetical protein
LRVALANTHGYCNRNGYCNGNGYCNRNGYCIGDAYCNRNGYCHPGAEVYADAQAASHTAASAVRSALARVFFGDPRSTRESPKCVLLLRRLPAPRRKFLEDKPTRRTYAPAVISKPSLVAWMSLRAEVVVLAEAWVSECLWLLSIAHCEVRRHRQFQQRHTLQNR